ncbi:MAG: glycosyltransferase family 2 protein [Candidatus Omnitrophica bacterium]|nr:glycosyltransferase family 2 protein [Candidatus Omnitrophota bacterium]
MILCDIVIPIWNQPDRTRRCLESVLRSMGEPVRLILIDNGSSSPTQEYLERFRDSSPVPVHLIQNSANLGFIKATNQGIRAGQAPWVCLLNNDTVVTPGWLTEMLKVAADPQVGLVNPTSNSLGFHPLNSSIEDYAQGLKPQTGRWAELPIGLGFCLLAKRSLFDQVGLLDESFGMGNFEDDDLSRRVKGTGLRCVRACAAYVHHEEKVSFKELPDWEKGFEQNRKRFEERWGRSLRILWAPIGASAPDPLIKETALKLAAQGHWLHLAAFPGTLPEEICAHAQVSPLRVNPGRWRLQATSRLLLRRKKPFDLVISHDAVWSRWIQRLRWLHQAQLLPMPTGQQILETCRRLSHRN